MSARMVFFVSFALATVLLILLGFLDPRRAGQDFPSNRDLKQAASIEGTNAILKSWGETGKRIAKRNLSVDWLFIAVYSTMWISGGVAFRTRHVARLGELAVLFAIVGIAGAVCDVIENICLQLMLHGNVWPSAPSICAQVSRWNVALFVIAALGFISTSVVNVILTKRGG